MDHSSSPLAPEHQQAMRDAMDALKRADASFAPRRPQLRMIATVAHAMSHACDDVELPADRCGAKIAVIEAGTGTGKSLGSLVPGVVMADSAQARLVVSTSTIALQHQYAEGDIRRLARALPQGASFALVKGRRRYVCDLRLDMAQAAERGQPVRPVARASVAGAQVISLMSAIGALHARIGTKARALQAPAAPAAPASVAFTLAAQRAAGWSGDRDDLDADIDDADWNALSTASSGCLGQSCPAARRCAFAQAREAARNADVLVVNHAVLLATLASPQSGDDALFDARSTIFVIDEAHAMVAAARESLAVGFSLGELGATAERVGALLPQVERVARSTSGARNAAESLGASLRDALGACRRLASASERIEAECERRTQDDDSATMSFAPGALPNWLAEPVCEARIACAAIGHSLDAARSVLAARARDLGDAADAALVEMTSEGGRAIEAVEQVAACVAAVLGTPGAAQPETARTADADADAWIGVDAAAGEDGTHAGVPLARWIERRSSARGVDWRVCASPISPREFLLERLWKPAAAAVVASATISAAGDFTLFMLDSGLDAMPGVRTLRVDSPFDYAGRACLRVPAMHTLPKAAREHTAEVAAMLPQLVTTPGTLALFASREQLRQVAASLPPELAAIALVQGSQPKRLLLAEHRRRIASGGRSLLMGLQSLAEGVDLPRDECTHVIIAKLPFAVPDHPVDRARHAWVASLGMDGFDTITLPEVIARMNQWVGRLLRTVDDHGFVTVLDRRLAESRWGRRIIDCLPPFALQIERVRRTAPRASAEQRRRA